MLANQMMTENSQGHVMHGEASDILKAKWARLIEGAGDGLPEAQKDWSERCLAQMFENEIGHLRNEVRQRGHITESTAAAAIPDYVKFVFPLIRRVWANLIANGLVSVQPMSAPIGGIFFWEYKYATTKGTITAGDNMVENLDRFYTSERVWHETIDTGDGATVNFATPGSPVISHLPIKAFDNFGQLGIEFASVATGTGAAMSIIDSGAPGVLTGDVGAASQVTLATGAYDITFSTAPALAAPVYANYWFSMEAAIANVPEMEIDISLQPVQAWSRKLKALWSAEAADDLRAMLGMDIEGELVGGLASEVALEVDREIIQDLQVAAEAGTNTGTFDATVPPARSPIEHYSGIITQFDKIATEIHTRTKRGPGNFIVCAPDVNTVLSALSRHGDFKGVFNDNPVQPAVGYGTGGRPNFPLPNAPSGYGIYTSGTLQNRWRVIVDPWMDSGKAVVGLKGSSFVDSGYVYAPYVPLQVTSTFLDPANFQARKGLRTRYATKLTNTNFYGSLAVTNTP